MVHSKKVHSPIFIGTNPIPKNKNKFLFGFLSKISTTFGTKQKKAFPLLAYVFCAKTPYYNRYM